MTASQNSAWPVVSAQYIFPDVILILTRPRGDMVPGAQKPRVWHPLSLRLTSSHANYCLCDSGQVSWFLWASFPKHEVRKLDAIL